jgi:high-affinity iron transporter
VQFLSAAGLIDVLSSQVWDSSRFLSQDSIFGKLLHTLIGYNDRPSELQLIAYLATLVVMAILARIAAPPHPVRAAA